MSTRLISIFGTYDFLGKSLPGTALVVGVAFLLPNNSIPTVNTADNFLVLVIILAVVFLIGTLFGEFVHSLANTFEDLVAWFGGGIRKTVAGIAKRQNWKLQPSNPEEAVSEVNQIALEEELVEEEESRVEEQTESYEPHEGTEYPQYQPLLLKATLTDAEEDVGVNENHTEANEETEERDLTFREKIRVTIRENKVTNFFFRSDEDEDSTARRNGTKSRVRESRLYNWIYSRYVDLIYVAWPHRAVFLSKLDLPHIDDPANIKPDLPVGGSSFPKQYLEYKTKHDYHAKESDDARHIYPVVISSLSNAGFDRAFRYQARYSFCRSMWVVLTLLSVMYILITISIPDYLMIEALRNYSYISNPKPGKGLTDHEIRFVSASLYIISIGFASAAGAYKKYYIEYIMSELYVLESECDNQTPQNSAMSREQNEYISYEDIPEDIF